MTELAKLIVDAEHYADTCASTKLTRNDLIVLFMRSNAHFYGIETYELGLPHHTEAEYAKLQP